MKKLLLANIGSRNLQVINSNGDLLTIEEYIKDNRIEEYIDIHENSLREKYLFRNFTKDLLYNVEKKVLKIKLKLGILTEIIIDKVEYDEIILFYSDQEDGRYNHQDTLYAAQIISRELIQYSPNLKVDLRLIAGNPTDENNLFSNYAKHAKALIDLHPDDSLFAYLDAGATSQMKYATKIVFEYYLRQHSKPFKIQYISYLDDYSNNVERQFSQAYYTLDVASQFVKSFNFQSAAALFNKVSTENNESIRSLYEHLVIAAHRLAFNSRLVAELPEVDTQDWAISYKNGKTTDGFLPYTELVSSKAELFEISSICQHYFNQKNYTLAIATYYRLCEEICQTYVKSQLGNTLSVDADRKSFERLAELEVKDVFSGQIRYGLPLLLSWCFADSTKRSLPIANLFKCLIPTISHSNRIKGKGLNELRNRCWLAHNNRSINSDDIEKEVPSFFSKDWPDFVKYLKLPKRNIFEEIQTNLLLSFQNFDLSPDS